MEARRVNLGKNLVSWLGTLSYVAGARITRAHFIDWTLETLTESLQITVVTGTRNSPFSARAGTEYQHTALVVFGVKMLGHDLLDQQDGMAGIVERVEDDLVAGGPLGDWRFSSFSDDETATRLPFDQDAMREHRLFVDVIPAEFIWTGPLKARRG